MVVLLAILATVGVAFGSAVLDPVGDGRASPSASLTVAGPPTPAPDALFAAEAPYLGPDALRAGLGNDALDGALVFVIGRLDVSLGGCPRPAGCPRLAIDGLERLPIEDGRSTSSGAVDLVPAVGELAFRGGRGTLTYLGPVTGRVRQPATVADLVASLPQPEPGSLFIVGGWLITGPQPMGDGVWDRPGDLQRGGAPGDGPGGDGQPGESAPGWLTEAAPAADGRAGRSLGIAVRTDPIRRGPSAPYVVEGPFLVRQLDRPDGVRSWTIVAALRAQDVVQVLLPDAAPVRG
jgi:hypothetical protein